MENNSKMTCVPFHNDADRVDRFARDFDDALFPLSVEERANLLVLDDASWPQLWQPDIARHALVQWRKQSREKDENADEIYHAAIRDTQQSLSLPKMFVRKIEQLRPDVYPLQKFASCAVEYAHAQGIKPALKQTIPSKDFFYQRSYWQVRTWLENLPLRNDEIVYVAREPEHTFVIRWDFFVKHWDAFYCDRFCMVNVIGDDIRWFLFFEMEQAAVWGCTVDYAQERDYMEKTFAEQPVVYRREFLEVAAQRERNRRKAMTEYLATQSKA